MVEIEQYSVLIASAIRTVIYFKYIKYKKRHYLHAWYEE